MGDSAEAEYVLAGFAAIFSLSLALVLGTIGMSQHEPTAEAPAINVLEGLGEFFSADGMTGWTKFLYTMLIISPMTLVGAMIALNYARGR